MRRRPGQNPQLHVGLGDTTEMQPGKHRLQTATDKFSILSDKMWVGGMSRVPISPRPHPLISPSVRNKLPLPSSRFHRISVRLRTTQIEFCARL